MNALLIHSVFLIACIFQLSVYAQEGTTLFETLDPGHGASISYAVHLPSGFQKDQTYPVLIGPGEALEGEDPGFYWQSDPYSHGWIIVDARLWEQSTIQALDTLLDKIDNDFHVEGRKFHAVCWSGNSAGIFRLIIAHAGRFHSITGMAGNPSGLSDSDVTALKDVSVQFVVGSKDTYWKKSAERSHQTLKEGGVHSSMEIIPEGEHVLKGLIGAGFMQRLETLRSR